MNQNNLNFMKFKEYLIKESIISNYNYSSPSNYRKKIFDFYAWSYFYQHISFLKNHIDQTEEIEFIIKECTLKIVENMIEFLRQVFVMAILGNSMWCIENEMTFKEFDNEEFFSEELKQKDWYVLWHAMYDYVGHDYHTLKNYNKIKKDIEHIYGTEQNFIIKNKILLDQEGLINDQAWSNICDNALKIYSLDNKTLNEKIIHIDHCVDICHNNGSIMNYFREFGGSQGWIEKTLDYKSKASIKDICKNSSISFSVYNYIINQLNIIEKFKNNFI